MTDWPNHARTCLLLLMLTAVVLSGCALQKPTAGPDLSPPKISAPSPSPTSPQMAGLSTIIWQAAGNGGTNEQFSFLTSRDDAPETLMQTGSSPFFIWRPTEPGQYRIRVSVRGGTGRTAESDWSDSFQVLAPRVAVLPFVNLSTVSAPLEEMRQTLQGLLHDQGMDLLEEEKLLAFMKRHRLRNTASLTPETARAFFAESGVTGVLITQLTQYHEEFPPKFALVSRLVTTGEEAGVCWAKSLVLTGEDNRGLLDLGLIRDVAQLSSTGLARLAASLSSSLDDQENGKDKTFQPQSFYRSPSLEEDRPFTVAILPFVNHSQNRFAGELIGLHFLRHLSAEQKFRVLDPGLLEEQLLSHRIITPEGASLDTAYILFSFLENVDLLLTGKVLEYEESSSGADGAPRVHFTVQALSRQNEEMVWSSISSNYGNEDVLLFDLGMIKTAHELASRMVRETVKEMVRP